MGYDVYGLKPKNSEYASTIHPGKYEGKGDYFSPEYKKWRRKEWIADATAGYYFRQSVGGYWGLLMSFADQVIPDLPDEVMYNSYYVIEDEDAVKIADHIQSILDKDTFEEESKEYLKNKLDESSKKYNIEYNFDEEYQEFIEILETFVVFAKNSGGFEIR
jgi:hypothetical protein